MSENLDKTVNALMGNLEKFVSAKTIVGEPIQYKDVVVFPMADVAFGVAAGSFSKENDGKNNGAAGVGARVTPSAVLVIQNGTSKIVNIKDRDSINKIIELVPDVLNIISGFKTSGKKEVTGEKASAERIEDFE